MCVCVSIELGWTEAELWASNKFHVQIGSKVTLCAVTVKSNIGQSELMGNLNGFADDENGVL